MQDESSESSEIGYELLAYVAVTNTWYDFRKRRNARYRLTRSKTGKFYRKVLLSNDGLHSRNKPMEVLHVAALASAAPNRGESLEYHFQRRHPWDCHHVGVDCIVTGDGLLDR